MSATGERRARRGCGATIAGWLLLLLVVVAMLLAVWYLFVRPFAMPAFDDVRSVDGTGSPPAGLLVVVYA